MTVSVIPKYVTFELLLHAAFVADDIWGFMLEPARRWSQYCLEYDAFICTQTGFQPFARSRSRRTGSIVRTSTWYLVSGGVSYQICHTPWYTMYCCAWYLWYTRCLVHDAIIFDAEDSEQLRTSRV